MRYIIAGMRDFTDYEYFRAYMKLLSPFLEITEVVSGHAKGVDSMAEYWAQSNKIPLKIFPAEWDRLGKRAGHERNHKMAQYAGGLIAFWNGYSRGTKDMIKHATMAELDKAGAPAIKYGLFVNDTISFVILGFVMFMFIKSYNKLKKEEVVPEAAPTTKVCSECAMEIPIAAKKCGHCGNTAV